MTGEVVEFQPGCNASNEFQSWLKGKCFVLKLSVQCLNERDEVVEMDSRIEYFVSETAEYLEESFSGMFGSDDVIMMEPPFSEIDKRLEMSIDFLFF